jgi:hypothetical protein
LGFLGGGFFIGFCLFFLFVFFYPIVLGQDTSTLGSKEGKHKGDKGSIGGRGLSVCCGQ